MFVVTVAIWTAFFDAIIPGGSGDLNWRVVAGLLLGFLGTALLVGASPAEILKADLRGPIALTFASASWSIGSVYAKRHPTEVSPYIAASIQMIIGGVVVALVGSALGEWRSWHLSLRGLGAMAYLVVFGSILGYSPYAYALRYASATTRPMLAMTVACQRTVVAMALILGAVVWIQLSHKLRRTTASVRSDAPAVSPAQETAS